jgi:hypothetical protein
MSAKMGKIYIYCVDCRFFRYGECRNRNNMNINHWKHPKPFSKPEEINKKNDCEWFEKPKWYEAFGWGTRP